MKRNWWERKGEREDIGEKEKGAGEGGTPEGGKTDDSDTNICEVEYEVTGFKVKRFLVTFQKVVSVEQSGLQIAEESKERFRK